MQRDAPHMPPAHRGLAHTVGTRHAAAYQLLQVPRVVMRRRQAVADEQVEQCLSSDCMKLTARAASEAMATCE